LRRSVRRPRERARRVALHELSTAWRGSIRTGPFKLGDAIDRTGGERRADCHDRDRFGPQAASWLLPRIEWQ